eukprot:9491100-Pyramimonas_sp.AAC.1
MTRAPGRLCARRCSTRGSHWTNQTQEARVYSHEGPIGRRKRGYILTKDQSDAGRKRSTVTPSSRCANGKHVLQEWIGRLSVRPMSQKSAHELTCNLVVGVNGVITGHADVRLLVDGVAIGHYGRQVLKAVVVLAAHAVVEAAPIAKGEREYTRIRHQSRKGRVNIPIGETLKHREAVVTWWRPAGWWWNRKGTFGNSWTR